MAIPGPGAALHEAFLVETWTDDDNLLDHTIVDGDGAALHVERRTVNDDYNVFQEYPGASPQMIETTADGQWLDGGTQYTTHIQGPNANAYLDHDHDNVPDAASVATAGAFSAAHDDTLDPRDGFNPDVSVQNLFYLNNRVHDELAPLGFDAGSGNFAGDDPVLAEAQDGSRLNNANFAPTADGTSPRMQMFLWSTATPYRDSALDGDIVLHEYGHGITWRLIGDLVNFMGGAVGEGWSDTHALIRYDDDVVGEYSDNYAGGIRNYPYATYFEDSGGRTYEDFVFQVHTDGEIFAAIQWDIWEGYRDDGGIVDPRDTLLADMLSGMKITAVLYEYRPDFIDMRDGLLRAISGAASPYTVPADLALVDRWCYVWTANAKYGVGVDATTTVKRRGRRLNWSWTNGFEVPAECPAPPSPNLAPEVTVTAPASSTIVSGTTVGLAADASDADGVVTTVDFIIDGDTSAPIAGTEDTPGTWTAVWNSETVDDGSHTIVAVASDDGTYPPGSTTSAPVVVTVDNIEGGPSLVGVTAISYGHHGGKTGDRNLDVYLTVKDDTGTLVEGASVLVTIFHGPTLANEITYGVTDATGVAIITWKNADGSAATDCYWTDIRNIATTPYFWDYVEIETAAKCE